MSSTATGMKRSCLGLFNLTGRGKTKNTSKSFREGVKIGSEGLRTIGKSLTSGVTRAVFPEDLRVSEK